MVNLTLCMMTIWARGASWTEVVWPWHHLCCNIWSNLGDEGLGGEAIPTNADVYHVQDEVMINMIGCVQPTDDFFWRNDVRICRVSLGLYHAEGRMIFAL